MLRFIPYLLSLLLFAAASASLVYARDRSAKSQEAILKDKGGELAQADQRLASAKEKQEEHRAELGGKEEALGRKSEELKAKASEVSSLGSDLSAKQRELDEANRKIKGQEEQIKTTAGEIAKLRERPPLFSFKVESSTLANSEAKKEAIREVVTAAYDVIEAVYSKPYLLKSVEIAFVDQLTIAGAYAEIKITNSPEGLSLVIRLRDFDKANFADVNAIIHEIIHSFHGLALLDPPAYEEGITTAATEVVMEKLIAEGKITAFSPLYLRINLEEYLNSSTTVPSDRSFYGVDETRIYYQLVGYGWYQIGKADSNFFKTFNEKLYQKTRNGEKVSSGVIKQLVSESTTATIQGRTISQWLETKAFK